MCPRLPGRLHLHREGKGPAAGKGFVVTGFKIDYTKCMFCALCVDPCPVDCIFMGSNYDHQLLQPRRLRGRLRQAAARSGLGPGDAQPDGGAGVEAGQPAGVDEDGRAGEAARLGRAGSASDRERYVRSLTLAGSLGVLHARTRPVHPDLRRGRVRRCCSANLLLGKLVRPDKPSPEKGEVYECGEQPIGTAWIQFDLRFYVVALLFVIFDVELAFFFPWAVVFGSANRLPTDESRPAASGGGRDGLATAARAQPTSSRSRPTRRTPAAAQVAGLGGVRGHPGVLRRAAGRLRLPVAARRPRLGAQHGRARTANGTAQRAEL